MSFVICYGFLWALTAAVGANQIRDAMLAKMAATSREPENQYHAAASSPGPFIVIVEYGDYSGPLAAYDRTEWHVWLLGFHARLMTTATSVS